MATQKPKFKPNPPKETKKKTVTIITTQTIYDLLQKQAKAAKTSVNSIINQALEYALENSNKA